MCRVNLGPVGKGLSHVRRQVLAFRRLVEEAVVAEHGQLGVAAASRIRTACVAQTQAIRVGRVLADAGQPGSPEGKLSHDQWLAYSDRLVKYQEAVDRSLAALGLTTKPRDAADFWKDVYDTPPAAQLAAPDAPAATDDAKAVEQNGTRAEGSQGP